MKESVVETTIAIILTAAVYSAFIGMLKDAAKINALHLISVWFAFCSSCVSAGLLAMSNSGGTGFAGKLTSFCNIAMMVILLIHAIWATAVKVLPDEKSRRIFMRDSRLIWRIWLVPFTVGVVIGLII